MTWGSHCLNCGRTDCNWVRGDVCEGNVAAKKLEVAKRHRREAQKIAPAKVLAFTPRAERLDRGG
jgi:hypothetical protein